MKIKKSAAAMIFLLVAAGLIGGLASAATLNESDLTADSLLSCIEEPTCTAYVWNIKEPFFSRYIYGGDLGVHYYTRATYEAPLALTREYQYLVDKFEAESLMLVVFETYEYRVVSTFSQDTERCSPFFCLVTDPAIVGKLFENILAAQVP